MTALASGASFNALSYMVTGLPSGQHTRLTLHHPLFMIPSPSGTTDYSFTVDGTRSITSGSVSLSLTAGSNGLTLSNNNTTVTANSGLTAGTRNFVTVTYTPKIGSSTTTQFAIQRLDATGTAADSKIDVTQNGHIRAKHLPAGVYLRGHKVKYEMLENGKYSIAFAGVGGVTFNTDAVTFNPSNPALTFTLASPGTSVTINDDNTGTTPMISFTLDTNLGPIDPQIINDPDED